MHRYIFPFFILTLLTQSCQCNSGEEREPLSCLTPVLESRVTLDSQFTALSGVAEVAYRADLNSNEMELLLLNVDGDEVGRVLDSQILDDSNPLVEQGERIGAIVQKIGDLELVSSALQLGPTTHETIFTLRRKGGIAMRLVASFRDARCEERGERALHFCAPQLSGDISQLLLPSCGLDFDIRLERGERPLLTNLRLEVPSETIIEGADGVLQDKEIWSTFNVLEDGAERDPLKLDAFITAADLGDLLKQSDFRQLMTIAGDATWSRALKHHVSVCLQKGFEKNVAIESDDAQMSISALKSGDCGKRSTSGFTHSETRRQARVKGDPHLVTFDGRSYDFQAIGEFVLVRRKGPLPFEVQGRFAPIEAARDGAICDRVTWTTAVALKLPDSTIITAEMTESGEFVIMLNGQSVDVSSPPVLADGHTLFLDSRDLRVLLNDDVEVRIRSRGKILSVTVLIPEDDGLSKYEGLWGNADGSPYNDLVGVGARILPFPTSVDDLRVKLRPRWAVNEQTSLFTYKSGDSVDIMSDPSRPFSGAAPAIPMEGRKVFEEKCINLGVEPAFLLDCILDLYCEPEDTLETDVGDELRPALADRPDEFAIEGDIVDADFDSLINLEEPANSQCDATPPFTLRILSEGVNILAEPLTLTRATPGELKERHAPLVIPKSSSLESFLITLPPDPSAQSWAIGSVFFARPIASVVISPEKLDATHKYFLPEDVSIIGENGTIQETDILNLSHDKRKLSIYWATQNKPLTIRIILEPSE